MKSILLFLLVLTTGVYAQTDKWVLLAEKNVAFKGETDKVTLTGKEGAIDKVKLTCTQGTLELEAITIVMEDGEEKRYDARAIGILTNGMSSTPFAVPGKTGKVKRIELEYDSKGKMLITKKAKVAIYGKKRKDEE